jgi:hypothetical protein
METNYAHKIIVVDTVYGLVKTELQGIEWWNVCIDVQLYIHNTESRFLNIAYYKDAFDKRVVDENLIFPISKIQLESHEWNAPAVKTMCCVVLCFLNRVLICFFRMFLHCSRLFTVCLMFIVCNVLQLTIPKEILSPLQSLITILVFTNDFCSNTNCIYVYNDAE